MMFIVPVKMFLGCVLQTSRYTQHSQHFETYKVSAQNETNIPEVFQKYTSLCISSHNTRYASNLIFHVPHEGLNYGKYTFKFAITKIWEEIPANIKTLRCYEFKKHYKNYFILFKVIPLKLFYYQTFFETWHNQHS